VHDERIVEKWSDDTVLPLINFSLASFPTSETGGFSPFELKYGSLDSPYFQLPKELDSESKSHVLLEKLNENIKIIRGKSLELQAKLVAERRKIAGVVPKYVSGDLVLWNPRETPSSFLESKLSPAFHGPFEVIKQEKNDVHVRHLNLGIEPVLHVSRLKPFIGSRADGLAIAKLDRDQFFILAIKFFSGNPFVRESLSFHVSFEDGSNVDMRYSKDLAGAQQFKDFVQSQPSLLPLRFDTIRESKSALRSLNKLAITEFAVGDIIYLNLRFYDGLKSAWYDSIGLPSQIPHFVCGTVTKLLKGNLSLELSLPIYGITQTLTHVDCLMFVSKQLPQGAALVDASWRTAHPRLFE